MEAGRRAEEVLHVLWLRPRQPAPCDRRRRVGTRLVWAPARPACTSLHTSLPRAVLARRTTHQSCASQAEEGRNEAEGTVEGSAGRESRRTTWRAVCAAINVVPAALEAAARRIATRLLCTWLAACVDTKLVRVGAGVLYSFSGLFFLFVSSLPPLSCPVRAACYPK